jgi:hypothetical protein
LLKVLQHDTFITNTPSTPGITPTGPLDPALLPPNFLLGLFPTGTGYGEALFPKTDADYPYYEYYVRGGFPLMSEYTPQSTLGMHAEALGTYVASMHELGLADNAAGYLCVSWWGFGVLGLIVLVL